MLSSVVLPPQYGVYLEAGKVFNRGGVNGLGLYLVFEQALFLFTFFSYCKVYRSKYTQNPFLIEGNKKILVLAMVSIIMSNMLVNLAFVNRIAEYFSIFLLLSVPISISILFSRWQKTFIAYLFFIFMSVLYFRNIYIDGYELIPYSSNL
jgi:hypothetical protein